MGEEAALEVLGEDLLGDLILTVNVTWKQRGGEGRESVKVAVADGQAWGKGCSKVDGGQAW